MKTIPQLKKELEDYKIREKYYEGKAEARQLKREIFKLKHRNLIKAGEKFKSVGRTIGRNAKVMSKKVYEQGKHQGREIAKNQRIHGGFYRSNHVNPKSLKNLKYYKKKKSVPVKRVKRHSTVQREYYNPFGLEF